MNNDTKALAKAVNLLRDLLNFLLEHLETSDPLVLWVSKTLDTFIVMQQQALLN